MSFLFFILGYFLPFYLPSSPKNQNFKKMKKMPGDIIILQWCSKNHDHILYCSLDMVRDTCNYFSFWVIFCTFTLLTAQKIKIKKKKKMKNTPWDLIILHKCIKNHDHMTYCSWDMVHDRCNCYFSLCAIFCPFENAWRYHHFIYVHHKSWSDDVRFLRYGVQQMNGRMEKVTYRDEWPT